MAENAEISDDYHVTIPTIKVRFQHREKYFPVGDDMMRENDDRWNIW